MRKPCRDCGTELSPATKRGSQCRKCFNKSRNIVVRCLGCGNRFSKIKSNVLKSSKHFCGTTCFAKWRVKQPSKAKIESICSQCEKKFVRFQSSGTHQFCSKKCRYDSQRNKLGEAVPSYIDGRTPFRKCLKSSASYREWRDKVFARDNRKCKRCGANGKIHAHHIVSFSKLLTRFAKFNSDLDLAKDKVEALARASVFKPFWAVANGETLCFECHSTEHPNLIRKVPSHGSISFRL